MEDLDTPDRIRVLRTIDQLRDLRVCEDISLPQANKFELLRAITAGLSSGSLYTLMRHTGYSMTSDWLRARAEYHLILPRTCCVTLKQQCSIKEP